MSRADEIRDKIPNTYEKTPGYLLWDVSEAVGQVMEKQDEEARNTREKLDIDNLTGEELEKTIRQNKGLERREATYAIGTITVTGTGVVTAGDIFETPNGVQFMATETVSVVDSSMVNIKALEPGNTGIVGAESITQMPVTIAGINACINQEATHDGYDAESDDDFRERYKNAIRYPDAAGNKYSYMNWALEVPGVGDVEVYPLGHGDNTVDVVIIDSEKLPATELLVSQVQEHIDPGSKGEGEGRAGIGAHCYVESAGAMTINIEAKLSISGTQELVEEEVKKAIASYFAEIAFKKSADKTPVGVSYARIGNAIFDAEGVLDYENLVINGDNANIEVPLRHVPVVGTVIFTYA